MLIMFGSGLCHVDKDLNSDVILIGLHHVSDIVDMYGYTWFAENEFKVCWPTP